MDEILASIRRIIADDQDAPKAGPQGEPAAEPRLDAAEADEEVLDLAELPGARRDPRLDLEVEVPELSFQSTSEPTPAAPPAPAPEAAASVAPEPPSRPEPPVREPATEAEPPRQPERLVSRETTASVSQAFNLLSHTILTQNARTLEDLVGEMLKPMLKAWLDDNLPPLVERLVRAEIERVARGNR